MTVWWGDKTTGEIIPQCSSLFVDKLSMTLHVGDKSTFAKDFQFAVGEHYGGKLWESSKYYLNKKIYVEGAYVLLQCMPKQPAANGLRVAFNPAKIDPAEVYLILNSIKPGLYWDLINYGRITRIDISTDIFKLSSNRLFFHYPGISVSYNHLKSGGIQAAYLGTNEGVNQFVIYDKVAEVKAKNSKTPELYKTEVPKYETTRIEWRYRPKEICLFNQLYQGKNGFAKLNLSMMTGQPKALVTDIDGFVNQVFTLSSYVGLQQALLTLPKHRRKEVRNIILKLGLTKWWKPLELWETMPEAIEDIVNPKPNKFVVNK